MEKGKKTNIINTILICIVLSFSFFTFLCAYAARDYNNIENNMKKATQIIVRELTNVTGNHPPSQKLIDAVNDLDKQMWILRSHSNEHFISPPDLSTIIDKCKEIKKELDNQDAISQKKKKELPNYIEKKKLAKKVHDKMMVRRFNKYVTVETQGLLAGIPTSAAHTALDVINNINEALKKKIPDVRKFYELMDPDKKGTYETIIETKVDNWCKTKPKGFCTDEKNVYIVVERTYVEIEFFSKEIVSNLEKKITQIPSELNNSSRIKKNLEKYLELRNKIKGFQIWTRRVPSPLINIDIAADRTAATSGDSVKYTYTVTNRGNVPLVNVKVKDNKLPSIPLLRGDANSNGVLEKGETWIYESSQVLTSTSSTPISISNTAEATADGQKGGSASPASATAAVTVSAIMVTVPDVLGLTPAQAKETIKAAKLVVGDINKEESTQHKGLVSRQSPEAGKSIVLGSSVTIWLSKGQKKEVRRLFIDPPTKTTEMEKPVQLRALLWHTDGSEVDITKKANWTGAEKGIFTPQKPGTYQITATYNDFSGSATVIVREPTWSAIEDKPPISSADDVDANVPLPPADAYTWYVFCDPQTGEVTYGEHHQPGLRVMVGPFPGPRTAEKWIRDNCPRGRCTTDGRCAKEPARGGKWCVICDKNSGEITFSEHKPDSLRFRVMAGGLLGEPEARLWLEQNCPSQRCTSEGTCATSPAIAPTAADGWYVTCFLPAGKIEIGKKPFDPRTDKEIAGPFLGEPNARWWVDQNCPSWQCDTSGQCRSWGFGELWQEVSQSTEAAEARQDTSSKFAEIGDPETLATLKSAEEFRRENPGRPAWEEALEQRQEQVRNDPEWQMLMEQSRQNARNAAQGLANATGSGSSGSSSSGSSSGFDQQQELPYMEKDPYGGYQEYQSDTAKKQVPDKPSSQVGTTSTSGSGGTGSGMSWDECVNKYCSMCGGALNILEVSANEECNKCKQRYWEQIKQCASGDSGGSSSEDGYWKEMKVGPTDSSKLNAGPKVYYAARKYQPKYNNYHYVIGKKRDGGLAGFQIIYGPDTFMGCKRWLINKGYWTEEYWR